MSERQWTPEPLEIIGDDECPAGIPIIEISTAGGRRLVAHVQASGDDGKDFFLTDEDRAYARVLASAQALLAALEHQQWDVITTAIANYSAGKTSDLVALGLIANGFLTLAEARRAAVASAITGE